MDKKNETVASAFLPVLKILFSLSLTHHPYLPTT